MISLICTTVGRFLERRFWDIHKRYPEAIVLSLKDFLCGMVSPFISEVYHSVITVVNISTVETAKDDNLADSGQL